MDLKQEFLNTVFAVILAFSAFGAAFIQLLKSHKARVLEMLKEENDAITKRLDSLEKENTRLASENSILREVAMFKAVPKPLQEFLDTQQEALLTALERQHRILAASMESVVEMVKAIKEMASNLVGEMNS